MQVLIAIALGILVGALWPTIWGGAEAAGRLYASLNVSLERRTFLLRELDHRVRNTLAWVQSIASQTLRPKEKRPPPRGEGRRIFKRRSV